MIITGLCEKITQEAFEKFVENIPEMLLENRNQNTQIDIESYLKYLFKELVYSVVDGINPASFYYDRAKVVELKIKNHGGSCSFKLPLYIQDGIKKIITTIKEKQNTIDENLSSFWDKLLKDSSP